MIKDLSRDPDRSMFGFSREVAREVTHPLWPSRVPFSTSVSDIVKEVEIVAIFTISLILLECLEFLEKLSCRDKVSEYGATAALQNCAS